MYKNSRCSNLCPLFLFLLQMSCGFQLSCAAGLEDTPVDENVIQEKIRSLTHDPYEYFEVWSKIPHVLFETDKEGIYTAAQNRTLLRIQIIAHLRKLLAQCNRKTIPVIPELKYPKKLTQPFRYGMDPASITDKAFRQSYENRLRATQQSMEMMAEKGDLESLLRLFESLFVIASEKGIGIEEAKTLINRKIPDPKFRQYLLTLLEQRPSLFNYVRDKTAKDGPGI